MKKEKERIDLKQEAFRKIEKMHPHKVLLYVSMIGSSVIFLFMMVAFTVTRYGTPALADFQFPKAFVLSTILLLISSFAVSKVLPAFKAGDLDKVKKWLGVTLLLGLIFAASQVFGWQALKNQSRILTGQDSSAYLYVISGLHVAHMTGIMIFLTVLLLRCHQASKEAVTKLVYETNPYQKVRFEILTDFWHFIDLLWLVLFLYFFFLL